ncbi:MAG: Xaa-Pro peptidase family protein, partial [bacterium]|nr:Xaa-Pro peptidase family protein [bacterium]
RKLQAFGKVAIGRNDEQGPVVHIIMRLNRLREAMASSDIKTIMVTHLTNLQYLTGFTGSSGGAIVAPEKALFVTDFRYVEQVEQEVTEFELVKVAQDKSLLEAIVDLVEKEEIVELWVETDHLTQDQYQTLSEHLKAVYLYSCKELTEDLRLIKTGDEIQCIKECAGIAQQAFLQTLELIRPGVAEREIAYELEYRMRKLGATGRAFETIVASGARSALPHGVSGERRLQSGDLIVIDWGAVYRGYFTDMTRTLCLGRPSGRQREIYDLVKSAQEAAFELLSPEVSSATVDKGARNVIDSAGLGKYFGHNLGHGVGREVHEKPHVTSKPGKETTLKSGMVFTIEPGVYLPSFGGIRIEDMVWLTEDGYEILTDQLPRELIVL